MNETSAASRGKNLKVFLLIAAYVLYLVIVSALGDIFDYHPSVLVGCLLALPAVAIMGYAVIWKFRDVNSRDGLERHVQFEALAAAFLITMLAAFTYALLEVLADLPRLSLWFVWTCGMGSWGIASFLIQRKYR